jgi:hypothetical protein
MASGQDKGQIMGDFFSEVDSLGIVENHIQQVLKLEEKQAQNLLRRYREIRHELRDRLDRLPGDTFSAQQLRGVLVQIDAAISAMGTSLKEGMKEAAGKTALEGVKDALEEIRIFEKHFEGAIRPINLDAQLVAQETENFLINRYQASIDSYSEGIRSSLVQSLTTESLTETPYSTIIKKLGAFFQGEEWKLHRIARTELHNIYGTGKINGMIRVRDSGDIPDLMKTLIHPLDSRTGEDSEFAASLNLIVPLKEKFKYRWKGKLREFFSPPDRPNDRSVVVPYRENWNK